MIHVRAHVRSAPSTSDRQLDLFDCAGAAGREDREQRVDALVRAHFEGEQLVDVAPAEDGAEREARQIAEAQAKLERRRAALARPRRSA